MSYGLHAFTTPSKTSQLEGKIGLAESLFSEHKIVYEFHITPGIVQVVHGTPPCLLHRVMQRLFFGFKYKIKKVK